MTKKVIGNITPLVGRPLLLTKFLLAEVASRRAAACALTFTFASALAVFMQGCGARGPASGVGDARATAPKVSEGAPVNPSAAGMVLVKGGTFLMGSADGMPDESPVHEVRVNSFLMDEHEVTVAEFARFVSATGYVTDAERFGWSGVFDTARGEWGRRDGATWRDPEGVHQTPDPREPVTQVSWRDASEYARWAGKRLPTEAEWEYAARGRLVGKRYVWGDELRPNGKPVANWWQGHFPDENTGEDGFKGRAPVESFPPNGFGLYDMAGNVWEWCADWYGEEYYAVSSGDDPRGPSEGEERVLRGGSWLCSENYCTNYRAAARSHATPDTGLNNLGFRCVRDY